MERILAVRRHHALRLDDLLRLGVSLRRAAPFVVTADRNPGLRELDATRLAAAPALLQPQLELFSPRDGALP